MSDRLFIGIGVANAKGLPPLPGVAASVTNLADWATTAGYRTVTVTDETKPVDVARVRDAIQAGLRPGLSRIILYFCGHGFHVPPDQYLVLTAGPRVPDQRIARDGLRDMLATYGPRQICVVTDACLVMTPMTGLAVSVIDPADGEVPKQYFDGFYATQPGSQAFAFRASPDEDEMCLFSWVLHRGLTFQDTAACDPRETTARRRVVTSYSLGDYLDAAVPEEGALRSVWQQPQTNTGFRPPDHVYAEEPAKVISWGESVFVTKADPAAEASSGIDFSEIGRPPLDGILAKKMPDAPFGDSEARPKRKAMPKMAASPKPRAPRLPPLPRAERPAPPPPPPPVRQASRPLAERLRSDWRRPFTRWAYEAAAREHATLVLDLLGGGVPEIRTGHGSLLEAKAIAPFRAAGREAFSVSRPGPDAWRGPHAEPVVIRTGELCTVLPLYPGLWAVAQFEKGRGPIALAWGSDYIAPASGAISSLEVLKGMLKGRLSASDIPELAGAMRVGKHRDPIKGMVSAYLYDSIGDVDNIRRMAWFYQAERQDVPFDIALLCRLPFERGARRWRLHVPAVEADDDRSGPEFTYRATPACRVDIAGVAPLFRAGWAKLERAGPALDTLLPLADHLTENPIATFRGKIALAELTDLISTS